MVIPLWGETFYGLSPCLVAVLLVEIHYTDSSGYYKVEWTQVLRVTEYIFRGSETA